MSKFKVYTKSILLPILVGGVVGLIISNSLDYNSLNRPFLAPPSLVFPIIWTILYILMGISYGILKSNGLTSSKIDFLYFLQLFVNALWPIIFFSFKQRLLAFIWIVFLGIFIFIMIIRFYRKKKVAGLLQIPYLVWTLFATYLNFSIYLLNNA